MPQMPTGSPTRSGVFISYSHADRAVLDRLKKFLVPFERTGSIQSWDDTQIAPGMNWRAEIQHALESAKVAILLITADFLASPFIAEDELPPLLAAAEKDGVLILPVIVGPSAFSEIDGLKRFQAVNDPKKPLKKLSAVQRDDVFAKLAGLVRGALATTKTGAQAASESQGDKKAAVEWLRGAAEAGNVGAQAELGAWYAKGFVAEQNLPEAVRLLSAAADKGHSGAQYNLALMYAKGTGVQKDSAQSLKYLISAAELGHADAQYYLGEDYRRGDQGVAPDLPKARQWYSQAAKQGHPDALNSLGAMYLLGLGGDRDPQAGVECIRRAAEKGDATAQHNLGLMYREGQVVPVDLAEAYQWFRKSAEQGDANGQSQLGIHLVNGWGVPQNYPEAIQWLQKAADQGNAQAEFNLSVLYGQGKGTAEDPAKALGFLRRAAARGHPEAQRLMASLLKVSGLEEPAGPGHP